MKSYNEWILENPGRTINEYYKATGAPPVNINQPIQTNPIMTMPETINIKISTLRLFLYTGIVMGAAILWTIIYLMIIYGIAGGLLKQLLLKMSGQGI